VAGCRGGLCTFLLHNAAIWCVGMIPGRVSKETSLRPRSSARMRIILGAALHAARAANRIAVWKTPVTAEFASFVPPIVAVRRGVRARFVGTI
jgi:hypothetical protein